MKSTRIPVTEESLQNGTAELKQFTDTTSFAGEPGKERKSKYEGTPTHAAAGWHPDEEGRG